MHDDVAEIVWAHVNLFMDGDNEKLFNFKLFSRFSISDFDIWKDFSATRNCPFY